MRTKLIGAHPDDRWGSAEHLVADAKDWLQYLFLINLANATGKKPPEFKAAARPTDAAIQRRKELASAANRERTAAVLHAMRTGDWSEVGIDPSTHAYETR